MFAKQNIWDLDNRIKCICLIINKGCICTVSDRTQMPRLKQLKHQMLKIKGAGKNRLYVLSGCDRLVVSIYLQRKRCYWKGKYILTFHRYMCSVLVISNGKSSIYSSSQTWIKKSYNYRDMHGFNTPLQSEGEGTSAFFIYTVKALLAHMEP